MGRHRGVLRSLRHDDGGVALIIAMAIVMIAAMLVVVLVSVAVAETSSTGRERQRAVSISSAEGQVDYLISRVDHASVSSLTSGQLCGAVTPFTTANGPDQLSITSSVAYYDASNAPLSCTDVRSGARIAASAVFDATSTSTKIPGQLPAVRHFQTVVQLSLQADLNKAIFAQGDITGSNNQATITSASGASNGDIYSQSGSITCVGKVNGSVYAAAGSVTVGTSCMSIGGSVVAKNDVTVQVNQATVGGDISSSSGKVTLGNFGTQGGQTWGGKAYASGTVTGDICAPSKDPARCNGGVTVSPPPVVPFPQILPDSTWTNGTASGGAGYSSVTFPNCTKMYDANQPATYSLANWLVKNGPTLSGPQLVRMPDNCTVGFQNLNGAVIKLNADVAIWSKQGFDFTGGGQASFTSKDGTKLNLYIMQDWVAYAPANCNTIGIKLAAITTDSTVRALIYSPYEIYMTDSNNVFSGQIFGCKVDMNNQSTLTYDPVPVWGLQNSSSMSYKAGIVSKRESS